jgi:hypothetical protein
VADYLAASKRFATVEGLAWPRLGRKSSTVARADRAARCCLRVILFKKVYSKTIPRYCLRSSTSIEEDP